MNNLISKKTVIAASGYGPGGRNCNCCGPAPKNRKKHDRSVKRSMKQEWLRENNEALAEAFAEYKGNCKLERIPAGSFNQFATNQFNDCKEL